MAVDLGDHSSGFRHSEVIRFINNEILMNGGGPEFYAAFRMRPWNEIEDQLCTILIDPQVPRSFKRVCTWSALALSVRVGERQREQQAYMVGLPQNTMGQHPSSPTASVSELWQLRQQREEAVTQLLSTQAALQQAMRECDVLRRRLYHAERSAQMAMMVQDMVPRAQTQQLGASVVPLNPDHARVMGAMGGYDRHYLEAQASAATNVFYTPGSTSSWPLAMQPSVSVPVPYQFPPHPQFVTGSPLVMPLSPPAGMETEGSVVVPVQMPPVYQSSPFPAPCSQDPAGLQDQRSYMATETPPVIQRSFPPGNTRDFRQERRPEKMQETHTMGDNRSHIQGQGPRRIWERATLVDTRNDNEKKEENVKEKENREKEVTPALPEEVEVAAAAAGGAEVEEKGEGKAAAAAAATATAAYSNTIDSLQSLQDLHLPGEGELHSQSEKCPQATPLPPLGSRRSQIKKGVKEVQPTHVWASWSQVVRDSPKKQQPQLRKKDRKPLLGAASQSQPASASGSGQSIKL